ncbi:phosphoribosyl-ATP diphosphatase [Halobacterium rubrum]|uniref:phosphoribosyl-ATP diphosphatase n=1 Tax=Halobacterium TaxID=2239 RepID=UPI001F013CE8|nr:MULTISPECIES: phosphoribosyl-ATP diphosphatase [Halobacterium]MDH5020500.1 phosphoribosyl-ATP diphosphatase [Halobacterium rubrum]
MNDGSDAVLRELFDVIEDRKERMPEDSYTAQLLVEDDEKGENEALEKLGEEATEFLLAAKDGDTDELAHEGADIVYHMLVVLAQHDMDVDDLLDELDARR